MAMGDLIDLQQRRTRRTHHDAAHPVYYCDVTCPMSYLAAERIERALGQIEWVAIDAPAIRDTSLVPDPDPWRAHAERPAGALPLPLVWPEQFSEGGVRARRAASFACELGAGAPFALAAGRLAYCGGFDLDDPETLAEAAAASRVPLEECLSAAGETWRDEELEANSELLRSRGISELPAIRIGDQWFEGEAGLLAAGALITGPDTGR